MKEFDFIKSLTEALPKTDAELGIGDDAAIAGEWLVAKDIAIEGTHFTKNAPLEDIFFRVITANVSDICAMGGRAKYILMGVGLPANRYSSTEITDALKHSLETYNISLIGGDTVSSKDGLFISVTVLGEKGANTLLRSKAKENDLICISKPTGLCQYYLNKELAGEKIYDHYKVLAEVELGTLLSDSGVVNSCIDISDGVSRDITHIVNQSGLKAVIQADKIDTSHLPDDAGSKNEKLSLFLNSGEEFALMFTLQPQDLHKIPRAIVIGRLKKGSGVFIEQASKISPLKPEGFEHQV